jgi:hypothetical protein
MAYVTILETEFDNIFRPERNWEKEYSGNANEIVYTKRFKKKPNVVIKVYSSIHKDNGISRGCGQDAIRVCAVNTVTDRGVRKSSRINRVPGWETRLTKKVTDMWNDILNN